MTPHRILVVDDEPVNLHIIQEFLDGSGLELDLVDGSEEAWARLQHPDASYSLAILDRMMPVMDGVELMRRMKADERFRRMPVIMQTAATTAEQIAEGIAAGAFYYLTKPYAGEALVGVVRSAIEWVDMVAQLEAMVRRDGDFARIVRRAEFACSTLDDVQACTATIASMCADPATAAIGIKELLLNAVEHGNLGITYEEKKALRLADGWEEEIARRAALPQNRHKVVRIALERGGGLVALTITDEGSGFDWRGYLDLDHRRAFDPNGRGIAMARMISFASMEYRGCGNEVHATLRA